MVAFDGIDTERAIHELDVFLGQTMPVATPAMVKPPACGDTLATELTERVRPLLDRLYPGWSEECPSNKFEPFSGPRQACMRLRARIESHAEIEEMLAGHDASPQLSAVSLHGNVWTAASAQWRTGHRHEAVLAAAKAVNSMLQAKLGRRDVSEVNLAAAIVPVRASLLSGKSRFDSWRGQTTKQPAGSETSRQTAVSYDFVLRSHRSSEREVGDVGHKGSRAGQHRGRHACVVVLIAAVVLLVVPAIASATSPVLEFVPSGKGFPISFTADGGEVTAEMTGFDTVVHCTGSHGGGEITGSRSTVSNYVFTGCETQGGTDGGEQCKTENANPEEITTGTIEAELVYIDQAMHEVGMLLNPHGGTYITFECGGVSAEGRGSFLSPVGPINNEASSFTATLSRLDAMQTPDEYENANGEKRQAIPMGKRGAHGEWVTTGVELSFAVHPSVPLEIEAITAEEIEAKQHEEETATAATANKRQQEETAAAAAAKKRQEEEAATATAAKRRQEEEAAAAAAAKQRQEVEAAATAAATKRLAEAKPSLTRGELLAKALKQCKKAGAKHKRMQCEKLAKNKYGGQGKDKQRKH